MDDQMNLKSKLLNWNSDLQRVFNELHKERLFISREGVRVVWQRHDLEAFQKHLKILEKPKKRSLSLAELRQKVPASPIFARNTFYIGNMKGVGSSQQPPWLTPVPKCHLPNCMTGKMHWLRPICSMIMLFHSLAAKRFQSYVFWQIADRDIVAIRGFMNMSFISTLDLENIDHTKMKAKSP